ncbi:MAG: bifunctional phosphoribosyl-AMP cyclohydrolase/phosphoribosyl-ATP diphosphatase HisIE [Phascolarctobacterium faecium]
MQVDFSKIKFDEKGLIPAIVQDAATNAVLMLAYMNGESLAKTVETGYTWFWSRSRQELWNKGASSGHVQKVVSIDYDCDGDSLLVKVEQRCSLPYRKLFLFQLSIMEQRCGQKSAVPEPDGIHGILAELYRVIQDKRVHGGEKSYTRYLFMSGQDKILKKVGEEAAETIIASKNNNGKEVLYEMSDLWYHCLVLLAYHNINPAELLNRLVVAVKKITVNINKETFCSLREVSLLKFTADSFILCYNDK